MAAPDLTVRDSERTVRLSQFKGQVLVLNFWATWC
ncbi:MAG: redoxin domain-containing protein, partial [Candidatus Sulfotelmatobacter sp.]